MFSESCSFVTQSSYLRYMGHIDKEIIFEDAWCFGLVMIPAKTFRVAVSLYMLFSLFHLNVDLQGAYGEVITLCYRVYVILN